MRLNLLLSIVFLPVLSVAQTYTYSTFYSFAKGTSPSGSLIIDGSGNLYGLSSGGTHDAGRVYKINPQKPSLRCIALQRAKVAPVPLSEAPVTVIFMGSSGTRAQAVFIS